MKTEEEQKGMSDPVVYAVFARIVAAVREAKLVRRAEEFKVSLRRVSRAKALDLAGWDDLPGVEVSIEKEGEV